MLKEIRRKLRGGLVLSALWSVGIGIASFVIVLLGHLIGGSSPTTQDLIGIPAFFATGGFVLGVFFSLALILGVRDGRLSRWKAGLLGFASGPVVMSLLNISRGSDVTQGLLPGSIMMGLLIGLLGALTLGVAAEDEPTDLGADLGGADETDRAGPSQLPGPGVGDRLKAPKAEDVGVGVPRQG